MSEEEIYEDDIYEDEGEDVGARENNFENEINAFERVGPSGKLAELLSGATTYGDMQNKIGREAISPADRFKIFLDAMSRKMNSEGIATISESDINNMLEKSMTVPNIGMKNPIAFILGYLATNGGSRMDHNTVMFVLNRILPKIGDEGGVTEPDVIRYARFWLTI